MHFTAVVFIIPARDTALVNVLSVRLSFRQFVGKLAAVVVVTSITVCGLT